MTEKPAYKVLDRLINHEWKTALETETQGDSLSFRGFYGEYEITVEDESGSYSVTQKLLNNGDYIEVKKD